MHTTSGSIHNFFSQKLVPKNTERLDKLLGNKQSGGTHADSMISSPCVYLLPSSHELEYIESYDITSGHSQPSIPLKLARQNSINTYS